MKKLYVFHCLQKDRCSVRLAIRGDKLLQSCNTFTNLHFVLLWGYRNISLVSFSFKTSNGALVKGTRTSFVLNHVLTLYPLLSPELKDCMAREARIESSNLVADVVENPPPKSPDFNQRLRKVEKIKGPKTMAFSLPLSLCLCERVKTETFRELLSVFASSKVGILTTSNK
uniref:15 kDa selenoprotein-like n=1 Tax=Rhizophora mucronata TaxID=61149 RepID=A0A2P2KE71_RHIMU